MARRHAPDPVDVAEVAGLQRGTDPKTAAAERAQQIVAEARLRGVHPWHLPDDALIRLAMLATARVCDRTAEIMLEEGTIVGRHFSKAPPDVEAFARVLTINARQKLAWVASIERPGAVPLTFTAGTRDFLVPEAQLPMWPGYGVAQNEAADWRNPDMGQVSGAFVRGLLRAAKEVDAEAALHELGFIPPEYAGLPDVLAGYLLHAEERMRDAEATLGAVGRLALAAAYVAAHEGFHDAMLVTVAEACPQVLGDGWAPMR